MPTTDLADHIAAERQDLAAMLALLPESDWDAPSLCDGWRVREVVAHMTMPFRHSDEQFGLEMTQDEWDFNRMADRCAKRDAAAPPTELLAVLQANVRHPWEPPGGGLIGALIHDVVHGLDISVPLGLDRHVPEPRLRLVLDTMTGPRAQEQFGVDLTATELRATDFDWSTGAGQVVAGPAEDLILVFCGRRLPAGRVTGELSRT